MATWSYLVVGLFLPLFPLSMVFNLLFARVSQPLARAVLLLAWPLIGLGLLHKLGADVPEPVLNWALATSALYAVRLLALRELGTWTGFLATSLWALLWIPAREGFELADIALDALGFSAPLALLVLITVLLNRRLGGAYAGISGGIAASLPQTVRGTDHLPAGRRRHAAVSRFFQPAVGADAGVTREPGRVAGRLAAVELGGRATDPGLCRR